MLQKIQSDAQRTLSRSGRNRARSLRALPTGRAEGREGGGDVAVARRERGRVSSARELREASSGYAFVLVPMALFASSSCTRSSTRSTSAASTGASSGRSTASATENYSVLLHDDLSDGRSRTSLTTRSSSRGQMALGLLLALIVNRDPRRGVLPRRVLLPVARVVGGDHGDRHLPAACGRAPQRDRARRAPSRGSATPARRCRRSWA